MKKIVLASNNKFKIKEIKDILKEYEILTLNDIGYFKEIEETGSTYLENALIKAKTISDYLKTINLNYDVLADDSGLSCLALNDEPGIYSARYASNHDFKLNRKKLIENLKGKDKSAYLKCILVFYKNDGSYIHTEGKTFVRIIDEERGDTSNGYDAIIYSEELGKTFGEAKSEEINKMSHRYKALVKLKNLIG